MDSWKKRPVGPKEFEFVIESENVGAWMAINNAFTFEWGRPVSEKKALPPGRRSPTLDSKAYCNGILVQLGKFWRVEDGELMSGFHQIEFWNGKKLVGFLNQLDLTGESPVWINIVARKKRPDEPVRLHDFRERMKLGEPKETGFDPPEELHHYLEPYPGGITLWPEDGYKIDATIRAGNPQHVSHTFTLGAADPKALRIQILRMTHGPAGPCWQEAESLRNGNPPVWIDCPAKKGNKKLAQRQEAAALEAPNYKQLDRTEVDRIVITYSGEGGQQIGKNPPQG